MDSAPSVCWTLKHFIFCISFVQQYYEGGFMISISQMMKRAQRVKWFTKFAQLVSGKVGIYPSLSYSKTTLKR
jgi:hypothetical protein